MVFTTPPSLSPPPAMVPLSFPYQKPPPATPVQLCAECVVFFTRSKTEGAVSADSVYTGSFCVRLRSPRLGSPPRRAARIADPRIRAEHPIGSPARRAAPAGGSGRADPGAASTRPTAVGNLLQLCTCCSYVRKASAFLLTSARCDSPPRRSMATCVIARAETLPHTAQRLMPHAASTSPG